MLRSFLNWLDEYVLERGLVGLATGALGILAFGATLSVILGDAGIRAGIIVAALLVNLGIMGYLLASTGRNRENALKAERLLARYCEAINDGLGQAWKIKTYESHTTIKANGDSDQVVTVAFVVESERLEFFRIRIGPGWNQPVRYRRRVVPVVGSVAVDGIGGIRWELTTSWLTDGRLEMLAHCPSPVFRGTEVALQFDLSWPGKCSRLVRDHQPDRFVLSFTRSIDKFTNTVVLPPGVRANRELIELKEGPDCVFTSENVKGGNQQQIQLVVTNVVPNRRQGLSLYIPKGK